MGVTFSGFALLSFLEARWGIRGIYVGYSWSIHRIYVCIGYVSGMYRVCIGKVSKGTGREGGGGLWMAQKKEGGVNDNIDNLRTNQ